MKVYVVAKTRAKRPSVTQLDQTHFVVAISEPPIEGRANDAVVKALAEYFRISPSQVEITSGHSAKTKVVELYL
ncbi:MAG TPA: DUF167 domain-containing protein [Patescibacteria group bacterium]